jgi:hypothetical protein
MPIIISYTYNDWHLYYYHEKEKNQHFINLFNKHFFKELEIVPQQFLQ